MEGGHSLLIITLKVYCWEHYEPFTFGANLSRETVLMSFMLLSRHHILILSSAEATACRVPAMLKLMLFRDDNCPSLVLCHSFFHYEIDCRFSCFTVLIEENCPEKRLRADVRVAFYVFGQQVYPWTFLVFSSKQTYGHWKDNIVANILLNHRWRVLDLKSPQMAWLHLSSKGYYNLCLSSYYVSKAAHRV